MVTPTPAATSSHFILVRALLTLLAYCSQALAIAVQESSEFAEQAATGRCPDLLEVPEHRVDVCAAAGIW